MEQNLKLVVVGDGATGKSCMLISYTTGSFPSDYVPTVFDNYCSSINVDGRCYNVALWDTAGQEDYDRLRPLSYVETDVFLLCFDVQSRDSFANIEGKWLPELTYHAPNTPIILLANKIDLRENRISTEEGAALAQKHGLTYLECSALTHEGIAAVIPTAVQTAVSNQRNKKAKTFNFLGRRFFSGKKSDKPKPPEMPAAGLAPWINITTSTFADDWQRLLNEDHASSDIKFIRGSEVILAHQVVLSAASNIFKDLFLVSKKMNLIPDKYSKLFESITWINSSHRLSNNMNNLNIEVSEEHSKESVEITIHDDIKFDVFKKILQFLYTGLPGFNGSENKDFIVEVRETSKLFQLPWLTQVCVNQLGEDEFLNPSIGTWLNDETGSIMKRLFQNNPTLSDVQFLVEGKMIPAHKAVLIARCDVMAAMLGGSFIESKNSAKCELKDTGYESFLAILEYLYTDHAPIEEIDSISIMVLADRFCLHRLVTLCELYITKKVDRMVEKKVADGAEFVVNLLLLSQAHNADQLSKWCLHFIASNYSVFESCEVFSLLQGENRQYVEDHRWPPLSYFKELEEFEQKMNTGGAKDKCKVM